MLLTEDQFKFLLKAEILGLIPSSAIGAPAPPAVELFLCRQVPTDPWADQCHPTAAASGSADNGYHSQEAEQLCPWSLSLILPGGKDPEAIPCSQCSHASAQCQHKWNGNKK